MVFHNLCVFSITISYLFIEEKLRIVFMLIALLLYISIYNVYFKIKYYYKIRSEPGIKGDREIAVIKGNMVRTIVCAMAKSCGITNCES